MFSYVHRYHAGCFADVHKHIILIALLKHLQKKSTPFAVLDAYAGEGQYDLHSEESLKNAEHQQGIEKLYGLTSSLPLVQDLLDKVQHRIYPGSPALIAHYLREQDRGICVEGHPTAFMHLKQQFGRSALQLHNRDALEAIGALIPFKEKRGLIFIDPSYEVKKEYIDIANTVISSFARFSQGIYAIWYPLLEADYHTELLKKLAKANLPKMWHCEWIPDVNKKEGMFGSGMVIINTPWQLDTDITETFKNLNKTVFTSGQFQT